MTDQRRNLLAIIVSAVAGIAIGGTAVYGFMMFVFSGFAALHYDSDILNLVLHQRIFQEISDGNADRATRLLEGQINGEIYYVDGLLTSEADGLNPGHHNAIHQVLQDISDYRSRPDFRERVQYLGNAEPVDAKVRAILERYQTNAP